MVSLREEVYHGKTFQTIAQRSEIAGERCGIAGNDSDLGRREALEICDYGFAETRARRIGEHEIRSRHEPGQVVFHSRLDGFNLRSIVLKIAHRRRAGLHGDDFLEFSRERQREQAGARVEIERRGALSKVQRTVDHGIDQKAIDLEERVRTDAERPVAGWVVECDNRVERLVEGAGDRAVCLNRVDLNLRFVSEDLHRAEKRRKARIPQPLAQGRECFVHARGRDRTAVLYFDQIVRTRGEIADPSILDVELRTVPILEGRARDGIDFALIIDLSDAP